jgi:uncharacterized protein involved in exopolysaccharide biosynthesis
MDIVTDEQGAGAGIELDELSARLAAGWRVIVLVTVVSTLLFTAVAFLLTPVYRATVILAPAENQSSGRGLLNSALGDLAGGAAAFAGIDIGTLSPEAQEALAVLKSRQLSEQFISDWNLLPEIFARKWDAANKTWKTGWWRKAPTLAKGFDWFDRHCRTVLADKKTGLVTLQIDWRNREEAAAWANELVRRLNEEMRQRAIAQAEASMTYLTKETDTATTVTARDAISRLMETQIKQRMVANVSREYAFRVVDKALAADKDDPLRPQKAVMILGGFMLGAIAGAALAAWSARARSWRRPRGAARV